jgi:penicillin-binding protein 1A
MIRYFFVGCIIFLSASVGGIAYIVQNQHIDFSALEQYNPGKPSLLLDDEGHEWARFQLDRREPINVQKMPKHLINAFIAAEDHDFWHHCGISFKGIFRSLLINCYHGKIVQGASTITQQLVKLLFFDLRKTFGRKIKEQWYALLVEQQFSKEHILQTYLNHVYFGCGIYGVEAASKRFWGKSASELSIDEAATLAAVVKSPGQYCPLLYPLSSKKRRNIVLRSMTSLGFISPGESEQMQQKDLHIISESGDVLAPHLKETIRIFLENIIGKEKLYTGGFVIQTTLNKALQKNAQEEFLAQLMHLKKTISPDIDGSLICMHTKTGAIKALIGGIDFSTSQFNRAFHAKRQFGSIFKPFIYAAAIDAGMNFAQTAVDEPLEMEHYGRSWQPHNAYRTYEGEMTLARALSTSNNIISIKTLISAGIEKVVALAKKLRLSSEIKPYPSLALGCVDGTLKEAIGMFNIFPNNGVYVEPHYIKWIKNEWGKKIWKKTVDKERILESSVSGQVLKVLSIGMSRLKNRYKDSWIDGEAIGKTGTTNECRTNWFCGATPTYTTALYIGCDDNCAMGKNIYAAGTVFPIWLNLSKKLPIEQKSFSYDPRLKEIFVDSRTGRVVEDRRDSSVFSLLVM